MKRIEDEIKYISRNTGNIYYFFEHIGNYEHIRH